MKDCINDRYRRSAEKKRDQYKDDGMEEEDAEDKAVNDFVPDMRKALQQQYRHYITFMPKLQQDPFHERFMKTVKKLQKGFSMTFEEAVDNALNMKARHFDQIYPFREESGDTEDDDEKDEDEQ